MVERAHDPYWFEDDSHSPQRNTDYSFPEGWGMMSAEQKSRWFLEQRVLEQVKRQHDAGMWRQFDKFEHTDAKRWVEAMRESDRNHFRKD